MSPWRSKVVSGTLLQQTHTWGSVDLEKCAHCWLLINRHDKHSHIIQTHADSHAAPAPPLPTTTAAVAREERAVRDAANTWLTDVCRQYSVNCAHNHTNLHKSLIKWKKKNAGCTGSLSLSLPLYLSSLSVYFRRSMSQSLTATSVEVWNVLVPHVKTTTK